MTNYPILFLDIDGVLNRSRLGMSPMLPELVSLLAEVCAESACQIVVSSGWRYGGLGPGSAFQLALLGLNGGSLILSRVIGRTEARISRQVEIREWLRDNWPGAHFAVVDDWDMTDDFGARQIVTDPNEGLTEEKATALIEALRRS